MALNRVILSPQFYPRDDKGQPISLGYIYIGEVDKDPTVVLNQKQVSVQQEDGTVVAIAQPVRTNAGGLPTYNGSTVTIVVDGNYSQTVLDSASNQIYYTPSVAGYTDPLTIIGLVDTIAALRAYTGEATTIQPLGYYAKGDGGGGPVRYKATGANTDNGGSIITPNGGVDITAWLTTEKMPNVKWWGVTGDGATDDTVALQNVIDELLPLYEGRVYFPSGTNQSIYKITAALNIPVSYGWTIEGETRLGAVIKQFTDNTPIFVIAGQDMHSWTVRDMSFDYDNIQTGHALSNVFDFNSAIPGQGAYNFTIENISFNGGYYAIKTNVTNNLVWGANVRQCTTGTSVTGGFASVKALAGQPNNSFKNIYLRADSMVGPIFDISPAGHVSMDNIEINEADLGPVCFKLNSCIGAVFGTVKVENGDWPAAAAGNGIWEISDSSVTIDSFSITNTGTAGAIDVGAGNKFYIFKAPDGGGNNSVELGILYEDSVLTSGDFYVVSGGSLTQRFRIHTIDFLDTSYLTDIASTGAAAGVTVDAWTESRISADNGDSDLTIAVGDETTQLFKTTLTADRVVTLPVHGTNPTNVFEGLKYTVVRNAVTPGTQILQVKNSSGSIKGSLPIDTNGFIEVTYRRLDWELTGYGTFP